MHTPACSPRVGCGDLRNWANLMHNGVKFWKTFKFYTLWNAIMDDRYKYFVFRYICSWKKEFRSHFNSLLKSWDQYRTFNKMQYTACLVLRAYFQLAAKYAKTFGTFETYVIFIQNFSILEKYLIRSFRMYAVPSSLKRL